MEKELANGISSELEREFLETSSSIDFSPITLFSGIAYRFILSDI
jgi:CheY-specific phosphatase CheX